VDGYDVLMIDADVTGCAATFLANGGRLDLWRTAISGLVLPHAALAARTLPERSDASSPASSGSAGSSSGPSATGRLRANAGFKLPGPVTRTRDLPSVLVSRSGLRRAGRRRPRSLTLASKL
jgi:hypothetical protein